MKFTFLLILIPFIGHSQTYLQNLDILNYTIELNVNDTNNIIIGSNTIKVKFESDNHSEFILDLVQLDETGKGMVVTKLMQDSILVDFAQKENKLIIQTLPSRNSSTSDFIIEYTGIPIDGLIISQNKFGDRTFFGDNWPNRASHWFPSIDHPSEKATVTFKINHPNHYTCVSNGQLLSVLEASKENNISTFKSTHPLPTKVMVFGLAHFETDTLQHPRNLQHVNFVFPQNDIAGFTDMVVAADPLEFFESHIAPYPYEKLYNVQSTTRYGGMENAGCIFYDENAVTGNGKMENLIAHEIAHQWFGNSASEADWAHLWLSEGFATYFTNLHLEYKYGRDKMNEQLIKDRNRVIRFHEMVQLPLKDTISTDPLEMLNPNAYQRGAWTLHMLRNKIGDDPFWSGIRAYYDTYKYNNALSSDLQRIMQNQTNIDLSLFFKQWLEQPGHPVLNAELSKSGKKQLLILTQNQEETFNFDLEIELNGNCKKSKIITVSIKEKKQIIELPKAFKINTFKLDPKINLLFEETK